MYSLTTVGSPPAVLVIAFNRPNHLERLLRVLKAAHVGRVYVAIDGPRPSVDGEAGRVAAVLAVAQALSNEFTEIKILANSENRGCQVGVVAAIDWFFIHEMEGVILEDDCLPHETFYNFCATMLALYRDDTSILMVSGDNLLKTWRPTRSDYFFGDGGIWGWATWRRAWQLYDREMTLWWDADCRRTAKKFLGSAGWRRLAPSFHLVADGGLDTWDYQWAWSRALNKGLSVIPSRNLVSNEGFGEGATHTTTKTSRFANLPTYAMPANPKPPLLIEFDYGYLRTLYWHQLLDQRPRELKRRALAVFTQADR